VRAHKINALALCGVPSNLTAIADSGAAATPWQMSFVVRWHLCTRIHHAICQRT
jgi:hypothetical protein